MVPAEQLDAMKCGLAAEVLRSSGELRLRAHGTSMLPAVWPGDVLVVVRAGAEEARPGEIVLFGREGRLFAHRVVGRVGQHWITRGDRHTEDDPPVSGEELLGRVTAIVRGGVRIEPRLTRGGWLVARVLRRSQWATKLVVRLRAAAYEAVKKTFGAADERGLTQIKPPFSIGVHRRSSAASNFFWAGLL